MQLSYSGNYADGAKIKTLQDGKDVELVIRRSYGRPAESYIMNPNQAVEMAYALLRAVKQVQESEEL